MNLREKYLKWHCNTIVGQPMDEITNQALQFCEDFMEQLDTNMMRDHQQRKEIREFEAKIARLKGKNKKLKEGEIFQKNLANGFKQKSDQLKSENAELKAKVERLENCIHALHHEEYSYSPDEVERYIKQIYTGQHDQYFEAKIRECLEEWGQGDE